MWIVSAGFYQGTSNVRLLDSVFFSIKNKKFIKPITRKGNVVEGYFEYKLLNGRYVTFRYDYWTKREPTTILEIAIVELTDLEKTYHLDKLKSVKIKCDKKSEILEILKEKGYEVIQEIVSDFFGVIPGYHTGTDLKELAKKVYNEEAVRKLLEFIEKYNGEELFYQLEIE
jgi:uncharacterized protein (UPF0297 family)